MTSCAPLAHQSPASTTRQSDVGDVHHEQLPAHVGYRTGDFHVAAHVLAEPVSVALEGVDIIGILFVIKYVRRAVLGQERQLFPPYYPPCGRFLLCHGLLPAQPLPAWDSVPLGI